MISNERKTTGQEDVTGLPSFPLLSWNHLGADGSLQALADVLAKFLVGQRWYRDKARTIQSTQIENVFALNEQLTKIILLKIKYTGGDPQTYVLALSEATGSFADAIEDGGQGSIVSRLVEDGTRLGVLYDAFTNREFTKALLSIVAGEVTVVGATGELVGKRTKAFVDEMREGAGSLEPKVSRAEQSNTSIIYGDQFILKLFRKLEEGINPDIEIGMFLTEQEFKHSPSVHGALCYQRPGRDLVYLGILQRFVANRGDAWKYTIESLAEYFQRVQASNEPTPKLGNYHPFLLISSPLLQEAESRIGGYLQSARTLGERTAQMHQALSANSTIAEFQPEPFTETDSRELRSDLIAQADEILALLRQQRSNLTGVAAEDADQVLASEAKIRESFDSLLSSPINACKVRHHGDYHLGQVLYTGSNFLIIDYEGEPARSLAERRKKRLAMRDVAGMARSFQYAAYAGLFGQVPGVTVRADTLPALETEAAYWTAMITGTYLESYFKTAGGCFIPPSTEERRQIFDVFLLQKALYEVGYELNNRPEWVRIPLRGILTLVDH